MRTSLMATVASVALAGLSASAGETLTWVGGATGNFSDPGAWITAGGETATPAAGDSLCLTGACEVAVAQADSAVFADAATKVAIGADAKLNVSGATANIDINAVLSGEGVFAVTDSGANWVCLKADNSAFTGSFDFKNSTIFVYHAKALGIECPVTGVGPSSGGSWFNFSCDATLANPITLTSKNNFTLASYGKLVTFTGPVAFTGFTRFMPGYNAANSRFVFKGPMTVNGALDPYMNSFSKNNYLEFSLTNSLNMNLNQFSWDGYSQRVIFNCPVTGFANSSTTHFLNVKGGIEYVFNADITGDDAKGFAVYFEKGTMELSGHTVQIGKIWHTKAQLQLASNNEKKVITATEKPGTLVVSGMVTSSPTFNGQLRGHLSLDYDSTFSGNAENDTDCWILNLANQAGEASDTDGDITATRGHLTFKTGLSLPKVGNLVIKNDGRITVQEGVSVNQRANLHVKGTGTLDLAAGVDLKVGYMWTYANNTTEEKTPVSPGRYARVADPANGIAALSCILGDGVLTVTKPSGLIFSVR